MNYRTPEDFAWRRLVAFSEAPATTAMGAEAGHLPGRAYVPVLLGMTVSAASTLRGREEPLTDSLYQARYRRCEFHVGSPILRQL